MSGDPFTVNVALAEDAIIALAEIRTAMLSHGTDERQTRYIVERCDIALTAFGARDYVAQMYAYVADDPRDES